MQKVISINLNGNAYQLDEDAYGALVAYLDGAAAHLRDNPDLAEIMADIEQAIAEKCQRYLSPHKTVVAVSEVRRILEEMGPVAAPAGGDDGGASRGTDTHGAASKQGPAPKRLYQIREGAMISGVCNGLAAYLGIDVSIVRIVFVLLALVTKGLWVLAYVILMFVIPYASTSEERAAAFGLPLSAQALVDEAKRHYADFTGRHARRRRWRRHWRERHRELREQLREARRSQSRWWSENVQHPRYAGQVLAGVMIPVLSVVSAALFFLLLWAFIAVGTRGAVFGLSVPPGVPIWAAMLGLVLLYQVLVTPLVVGRYAAYRASGDLHYGWLAAWSGLLRVGFTVLFFWLAYQYLPEFRAFVNGLPGMIGASIRL